MPTGDYHVQLTKDLSNMNMTRFKFPPNSILRIIIRVVKKHESSILRFVQCSGGVLLDSKGNLIGINTAIFTRTGLFFFVPENN